MSEESKEQSGGTYVEPGPGDVLYDGTAIGDAIASLDRPAGLLPEDFDRAFWRGSGHGGLTRRAFDWCVRAMETPGAGKMIAETIGARWRVGAAGRYAGLARFRIDGDGYPDVFGNDTADREDGELCVTVPLLLWDFSTGSLPAMLVRSEGRLLVEDVLVIPAAPDKPRAACMNLSSVLGWEWVDELLPRDDSQPPRSLRLHRDPIAWLAAIEAPVRWTSGMPRPETPSVCILDPRDDQVGHLLLGRHRLICDDERHAEEIHKLQKAARKALLAGVSAPAPLEFIKGNQVKAA